MASLFFFLAFWAQTGIPSGMSGSATSGRAAQPARPLPKGRFAPKVDWRDVAASAGLTAQNISGDPKHNNYIVETTGNGVADMEIQLTGNKLAILDASDFII